MHLKFDTDMDFGMEWTSSDGRLEVKIEPRTYIDFEGSNLGRLVTNLDLQELFSSTKVFSELIREVFARTEAKRGTKDRLWMVFEHSQERRISVNMTLNQPQDFELAMESLKPWLFEPGGIFPECVSVAGFLWWNCRDSRRWDIIETAYPQRAFATLQEYVIAHPKRPKPPKKKV